MLNFYFENTLILTFEDAQLLKIFQTDHLRLKSTNVLYI